MAAMAIALPMLHLASPALVQCHPSALHYHMLTGVTLPTLISWLTLNVLSITAHSSAMTHSLSNMPSNGILKGWVCTIDMHALISPFFPGVGARSPAEEGHKHICLPLSVLHCSAADGSGCERQHRHRTPACHVHAWPRRSEGPVLIIIMM